MAPPVEAVEAVTGEMEAGVGEGACAKSAKSRSELSEGFNWRGSVWGCRRCGTGSVALGRGRDAPSSAAGEGWEPPKRPLR